jgi:Mrp family chromosome partitioning ATPase/tetratricopeptide (TPR) repeat protein
MSRPLGGQESPSGQEGQANVVAFVSTAAGTGCTSTVANVACALAMAGRRVLVIDWGSDFPRVGEFLEPLRTGQVPPPSQLTTQRGASRGQLAGETPKALPRHTIPEAAGHIDVLEMVYDDGSERFPWILAEATSGAALRKLLPTTGYDHILVDAPTVETNAAIDLVARVCDLAMVCFVPRPNAIHAAANLAARLRERTPIRLGVVPVATAFNETYKPRTARIRASIRNAFAPRVDGPNHEPPVAIELPSWSFDPFDPVVALLAEEPPEPGEEPSRLRAGYTALITTVTGGELTTLADVPPAFQARYHAALGMAQPDDASLFLVAWAPRDRAWADWVRSRLERAGARTAPLTAPEDGQPRPAGLVVISSAEFDRSKRHEWVTDAVEADPELNVFRVVVDGSDGVPAGTPATGVSPGAEAAAITALLTHFELIELSSTADEPVARPPSDRPTLFEAPPRHPRFVGRDEELERLRDQLVEHPERGMDVTIGGVPGVGKSEIALEYVHRFAGDYDLVYWVPAADKPSIMIGLADLARRLALPGSHTFGTTAVLRHLGNMSPHRRFLLVYDNLADEQEMAALRPAGHHGHVIVTASEAPSPDLRVEQMTRTDAVELLVARVAGLVVDDAVDVAAAADHLPMAIEVVASWLTATVENERAQGASVAGAARWAVRQLLDRLDDDTPPEASRQTTVSRAVRVVVETLRATSEGRVAVAYAELCSFLSQNGISLDVVRSTAMSHSLADVCGPDAEAVLLDAWEIDRALWLGARYGLFRIDWGRQNKLRVHRTVQTALRALMTEDERKARGEAVLRALARFAPNETELEQPYAVDRFNELQKHIFPSGSVRSEDPFVRRWLVNQTRFLYARGGAGVHRETLEPVERLLREWTERHGADDPLCLRLAVQLANLHRALGDHRRALELDDATLARNRRTRATNHPQSLINARGRSADLRGLGYFGDSLAEERAIWDGSRAVFGDDHRQTQMTAGNLTSSLLLSGDVRGALDLAERNYALRRRLFGEQDPSTWKAYAQVAVHRRELGEYSRAYDMLTTAWEHLSQSGLNEQELAVRWHQAIAQRCAGLSGGTNLLVRAKERADKALIDYRELHGYDHPNTLACMVSYAAAVRAVGGDESLALQLAEEALERYRANPRFPSDHPFVALYELSVGLAKHAAGQGGVKETASALELLTDRLGDVHPWTLAAAVNHARVQAAAGQLGPAATLLAETHSSCVEYLGFAHPHTRVATLNLAVVREPADSPDQNWREIDVDVPEI